MPLARDLHGNCEDGVDERQVDEIEEVNLEYDKAEPNWKAPWGVAMMILLVELCERLCYYTLKGTMRQWLMDVGGLLAPQASALSASASTLCYLYAVPGGWLADTIGRYKVILSFIFVYVLGTVMVSIAATAPSINLTTSDATSIDIKSVTPEDNEWATTIYIIGFMFFIAIGTGSIKPNVNSFGADQFLGGGEKTKPAQQSFFTYYYQSVNVGSFISFVFLVGLVDGYGFFLPYALSAGAMATAALIFLCASPWYKHAQLGATGGTQTMAVIGRHIVHSAIKGPKCGHKARAWASLVGWCLIPVFLVNSLAGAFLKDSEYIDLINILAILMGTTCIGCLTVAHIDNSWIETIPDSYCLFCDKCWFYGCFCCIFTKKKEKEPEDPEPENLEVSNAVTEAGRDVLCEKIGTGEIRQALGIVPLVICIQTCFHLCYNSMEEAFPLQACQMDCRLPGSDKVYNGAQLNLFNSAGIILGAPLLENLVYPMAAKFSRRKTCTLGMKIVAGLVVVASSNICAAVLEIYRRNAASTGLETECGVAGTEMKDISALWIALPMLLVGVGELMVNTQLYAYVYMAAPPRMRSTAAAFNLLAGGCLSHALTSPMEAAMFPHNLDEGKLEYYYLVNAAMGLFGIVLYLIVTRYPCGRNVQPKDIRDAELDGNQEEQQVDQS